jgi:hypothetical protein
MSQPTSAPVEIYLGKGGQTFGPYTVEQFEAIKATPDFAAYIYIWDGREPNADWKPIAKAAPEAPRRAGPSAPPPSDTLADTAAVNAQPAPIADVIPISRARKAAPILRGHDVPWIEALCHDTRNVIGGKLTQVTDTGCELVCPSASAAQSFGSQSHVVLNLLDPKSGQAMNVAARLNGVTRRDGSWSLKVLWDSCPELIVHQLEKAA